MRLPVSAYFYPRLLFFLPMAMEPFNYRQNTDDWYTKYPQCNGYRQSPIAISKHKSIPIQMPPLLLGLYDYPLAEAIELRNTGYTVQFRVPQTILGERPFIAGASLNDKYEVEDVHFHWGSPTRKGSEHVINGYRYDLEMHIVHRNRRYANVNAARNFEDGLAVIAVLFKVVKDPFVYYPGLNIVYDHLSDVMPHNATSRAQHAISLGSMLGSLDRKDFYTYQGSLTTPPCSEAVTWIIFSNILPIANVELRKFWQIRDDEAATFVNVRSLQPSNYRKVYHQQSPTLYYPFNFDHSQVH